MERPVSQAIAQSELDVGVRESRRGPHVAFRTPWRWGLVGVGSLLVGVGFVGVFVPGLPTTVFLIAASWCYVRSCPHLEGRLRESRVLGRYMRYVGVGAPMPRRARIVATATMWLCIALSVGVMCGSGEMGWWFAWLMGSLGVVGTWAVWWYGARTG